MVFRLYTPGQVKSFIFIRLPFASWFSICIKHSNQRLYRSTLGVDRRSSCRDISSRNPKGYLLPFYAQPWVQILEKPRPELVLCAERERGKKRRSNRCRCLEAVASLSTAVRCAILAPRVVGAGKTDGWKERGERKTTTYRRLIGRGVSPIPLDFRTRQKSCLYEEKHFWQPVAISARKRPDIVNGPSSNRRRKRERERYRVQNFPRFTRVHYYFRRMITPIPPIRTKSRTRNSLINYNYNRSIILMFWREFRESWVTVHIKFERLSA